MEDEQSKPEGPDLEAGVQSDHLKEGQPLLGHVKGEPVLIVRRAHEVFAIGSTCTHYGGPLAEGLVVDDTIRCPWHHACFSLRTGEAVGAPALNPVPRWRVETVDGVVRVVAKEAEAGPLESFGRRTAGPESVVIVGAGAAGSAAAETLRREGYRGPVILVDPDPDAPYDRPNLSKDYLAGDAPEEWLPLRPDGFYAASGIERVVDRVDSIDPGSRSVRLSGGHSLRFGALLLATGALPVRMGIPGADLPHVFTLRSLSDCRAIIAAAERAQRAVVLGASFIGMEVAASLRSRGLEVTVVGRGGVPFEHTLGTAVGRVIQQAHEQQDVAFRLGNTLVAIQREVVWLDDGTSLPADVVIVGIGVRPDTHVAEAAGLELDDGVLVDEYLETSAPGIFAAGDIARYPDPLGRQRIRVEHWVAAQRQGQAAARNILGMREAFHQPPFFWTRQWDVGISYVGHADPWDDVQVDGDPAAKHAAVRYLLAGETRALATLGCDLESLRVEAAMESIAVSQAAPSGRSR